MTRLPVLGVMFSVAMLLQAEPGKVPEGFESIFNHANLAGWHVSMTNHHGNTTEWRVLERALTGRQRPDGNGGLLLTDERYRDFELYVEVKPDFGCDSGVFLRSNANGQAYQVMLDYLDGGNVGGVYGERLDGVERTLSNNWESVWRKDDWNAFRVRMEGEAPRITVWLNGTKITEFQDTANHAAGGATDGMIGVQVHGGASWVKDGYHRFRNIAVKVLK